MQEAKGEAKIFRSSDTVIVKWRESRAWLLISESVVNVPFK